MVRRVGSGLVEVGGGRWEMVERRGGKRHIMWLRGMGAGRMTPGSEEYVSWAWLVLVRDVGEVVGVRG